MKKQKKKFKDTKFAGILKGVLTNPTVRTLVPFGNVLGAVSGVVVPDKTSDAPQSDPDAVKEISNPVLKDIVQAIVILGPIIYGIIELLKA